MSDNIEFNKLKGTHSFVSVKEKAWHNLGTIVDGALTADECLKAANQDFEVKKLGTEVVMPDGSRIPNPDVFSTVRTDTNQILGSVGSRYHVVQNAECFDFFDSIVGQGEAIYETAGVLSDGKRIFISAKMPEFITINGSKDDLAEMYVFLTNSHDGKGGLVAAITPIRIVCNNTLNVALRNCKNKISLRHTTNIQAKLKTAHRLMGLKNLYQSEIEQVFSAMANKKVDDDFYKKVIITSLANGDKTKVESYYNNDTSKQFERLANYVLESAFTHETQITKNTFMTAFGAYNSISNYFQNVKDYGNKEDSKFDRILEGEVETYNQRAFDLCLEAIN